MLGEQLRAAEEAAWDEGFSCGREQYNYQLVGERSDNPYRKVSA